jgi:hypothetical protein
LHRIDIPSAPLSLPAPAAYGTPGFFQAGNPLTATDATIVDADWANAVQEELVGAVSGAGFTLDKANQGQLLAAIRALSSLRGVQTFLTSGNFTVPAGVTTIEVELWAGGSGSWASIVGVTGGGGSGGGYSRKRISGLVPGAIIAVTVGAGGTPGVSSAASPGPGGASQFGSGGTIYCDATGGIVNPLGNAASQPSLGNQGGVGSGGDLNLYGGDGQCGQANQGGLVFNNGGMGGSGPLSGGMLGSGTTGVTGRFPGGGASGAGTGASGTTVYAAAAGAPGLCIVRW